MKKLVCEVCGSMDILKQGDFFVCQSCGCKYQSDSVSTLLKEIGEAAIPVYDKANNEFENMLSKIRGDMKLDDRANALKDSKTIIKSYPDRWQSWFIRAQVMTDDFSKVPAALADSTEAVQCVENARKLMDEKQQMENMAPVQPFVTELAEKTNGAVEIHNHMVEYGNMLPPKKFFDILGYQDVYNPNNRYKTAGEKLNPVELQCKVEESRATLVDFRFRYDIRNGIVAVIKTNKPEAGNGLQEEEIIITGVPDVTESSLAMLKEEAAKPKEKRKGHVCPWCGKTVSFIHLDRCWICHYNLYSLDMYSNGFQWMND